MSFLGAKNQKARILSQDRAPTLNLLSVLGEETERTHLFEWVERRGLRPIAFGAIGHFDSNNDSNTEGPVQGGVIHSEHSKSAERALGHL